jgi:hypothetical protein
MQVQIQMHASATLKRFMHFVSNAAQSRYLCCCTPVDAGAVVQVYDAECISAATAWHEQPRHSSSYSHMFASGRASGKSYKSPQGGADGDAADAAATHLDIFQANALQVLF